MTALAHFYDLHLIHYNIYNCSLWDYINIYIDILIHYIYIHIWLKLLDNFNFHIWKISMCCNSLSFADEKLYWVCFRFKLFKFKLLFRYYSVVFIVFSVEYRQIILSLCIFLNIIVFLYHYCIRNYFDNSTIHIVFSVSLFEILCMISDLDLLSFFML